MKNNITSQSKSFFILFGLAFLGTFASWLAYKDYAYKPSRPDKVQATTKSNERRVVEETKITIDTSDWKSYTNQDYGFEFKYKPDWKIGTIKNKEGYYVIQIDPGVRYSNIHVYISKDDFYAMNGLPAQKTEIAGKEALNLDGMVLGIKDNANYFTFDLGVSLTLKPLFEAMTNTIKFF